MLLKTGRARYCEWIHKGKWLHGERTFLEQAMQSANAADCLPLFPAVELENDLTDGSAAQFYGEDSYLQVAELQTKVGIRRNHGILVTMYGKSICDRLSVVISCAIQSAIKNQYVTEPGTRALFLRLALKKQVPSTAPLSSERPQNMHLWSNPTPNIMLPA